MAIVAVLLLVAVIPPGIKISPADGASEINPDNEFLEISTSSWGATLATVEVREARVAANGARLEEKLLDGHLQEGRYVLADGSNPLKPDSEYTVTVSGTVKEIGLSGVRDARLEETRVFTTVTTPMPIIPAEGIKIRYGEDLDIEWNIPISQVEYQLEGIQSTMTLEDGGRLMKISLAKFEQGKEYPLRITGATSNNNRDLQAPFVSSVKTAAPLQVVFSPADGTVNASIEAHPTITFSEPVSNAEIAKSAVSIEPEVPGRFNWLEPNKLEFVPEAPYDYLQDVTLTIKGGPPHLRGIGGGYLEADTRSTFTTAPYKSIDVDITNQVLTLYENGVPVESFACSTGLPGTDTPLGDYTIYAKLTKTDMRGPGYFAPAVPWVMVFKGDYTIHGNYWATAFGRPSSHGCVGLPVSTAEYVYNWTPIGTPVHIHE